MKARILLLIIITFFFVLISEAQIRVGLQTGLNLGSLTLPDNLASNATRKNLTGFTIGGVGELALTNSIYLQIEPRYIQKGFKSEITDATGTAKGTETINYFELPILIKVEFGGSYLRSFVLAGPNIGFLLSASEEVIDFSGQSFPVLDTKSNYKSYDVALDFGAGVEYRITSTLSLFSSGRYSLGLVNVYDVPGYSGETRGIQIYIGALFSLD